LTLNAGACILARKQTFEVPYSVPTANITDILCMFTLEFF